MKLQTSPATFELPPVPEKVDYFWSSSELYGIRARLIDDADSAGEWENSTRGTIGQKVQKTIERLNDPTGGI